MEVWPVWCCDANSKQNSTGSVGWVGFVLGRIQRGRSGDSVVNRTVLLFYNHHPELFVAHSPSRSNPIQFTVPFGR